MSFTFTPSSTSNTFLKRITVLIFCCLALTITQRTQAQTLPHPDHIVILIEENQANSQVIGNTTYAPYINQLVADTDGIVMQKMFALTHPSEPNYLDFFSGSNQGVTDDNISTNAPFTTDNLARELLDKGLTFKTYSQDLPSVGFDGASSGQYVRKHNPVVNWQGISTNQVPDSLNQPWTAFPSDFTQLPTVSYVVPNEDSDMHNGFGNPTIAAGDFWFKEHMKPFMDWVGQPNSNTLFIYTFDEDDGLEANNIPTVFYGPMVQPKAGGNLTNYTLYSILRTVEDIYGLRYAGQAANTPPILDCWKQSTGINTVTGAGLVKCMPNPASSTLQFKGDALSIPNTEIEITDITGRRLVSVTSTGLNKLTLDVSAYAAGLYFYNLVSNDHSVQSGKFNVTH